MKKPAQPKPKKKASSGGRQNVDYEEAKRSAMAMFDVSLNNFRRAPDNKWHRTPKSKLPTASD